MGLSSGEIVILGGGPAGVFTACALVKLGLPAVIISRPRPFPAWEGISERPLESLRHFGFTQTLASIGPMVAREAHWNGISQVQNREYILNRTRFDQALLRDAKTMGVRVIEGRIEKADRRKEQWQISYVTNEGSQKIATDFLVEARGRESRLGRRMMAGKFVTAPATSALLKSFTISPDLAAMTAVASFAGGWAWFLRDGEGTAILQLFVGSDKGALPARSELETYFLICVSQIPEAGGWLEGAKPRGAAVSVRTAAAQKVTPVGGDNFLVVGDGSMALDPLSGNGIFYAMGSGLAAAPVINTLLRKPAQGKLALQFFQERIDHSFTGGCVMGREFYSTEERWPDAAFWTARRNWPPGDDVSHPDPLSQPARRCKKPVVRDGYIVRQDVIVSADQPRGVWQVDGVPLVALLELIRQGSGDAGHAHMLGVTAAQVLSARQWLAHRQII